MNKNQWTLNQNTSFIQENALESYVCKILTILLFLNVSTVTPIQGMLAHHSRGQQHLLSVCKHMYQIDGLVQERRNSSALAMELCLSSTNPLKWFAKILSMYLVPAWH